MAAKGATPIFAGAGHYTSCGPVFGTEDNLKLWREYRLADGAGRLCNRVRKQSA